MTDSLTSSTKFQYRGDLAQTPLPEILVTIHRYKAPGVIECRSKEDVKNIYIDDGNIIFATSSNLEDSLGYRLLNQGKLTQDSYEESVRRLKSEQKRQGAILVEMNALQPKDLFVAVKEQVQEIVWSIFEWEEGGVVFRAGRERHLELIKLNIPTRQAVLQGVRRVRDAKMLVSRVGTKATLLLRDPAADFSDLKLGVDELNLLNHVDGKKTLWELTQVAPLPPAQNAKILYGFYALNLLTVKTPLKVQVKNSSLKYWGPQS